MSTTIKDLQTLTSNNINPDDIKFLYKRTTTKKIQVWAIDKQDTTYRTILGQLDGKLQIGSFNHPKPKNIGKKNETTSTTQCTLEVEALYIKKIKEGYFEDISDVDTCTLIRPMLAHDWKDYRDKVVANETVEDLFLSNKLDGGRCLATIDGLFSRTGERILSCDHIRQDLSEFFEKHPNIVLDGELYNHDIGFNNVMSIFRREYNTDLALNTLYNTPQPKKDISQKLDQNLMEYHIFDYISSDVYFHRYKQLLEWFNDCNIRHYSNYHREDNKYNLKLVHSIKIKSNDLITIEKHYIDALSNGYEGQMIRYDKPYINKRTKYLLKHKEWMDSEYILLDILEGSANWAGKARVAVFDGFEADVVGDYNDCEQWLKNKDDFIGKPTTVKYFELTEAGVPRFGKVKQLDRSDV